jgi:hypothetical protein
VAGRDRLGRIRGVTSTRRLSSGSGWQTAGQNITERNAVSGGNRAVMACGGGSGGGGPPPSRRTVHANAQEIVAYRRQPDGSLTGKSDPVAVHDLNGRSVPFAVAAVDGPSNNENTPGSSLSIARR